MLAENAHLTYKYLTQYMFDYLDALISLQSSPGDAYNKFDALAADQLAQLRKAHQRLAELARSDDKRAVEKAREAVSSCMST